MVCWRTVRPYRGLAGGFLLAGLLGLIGCGERAAPDNSATGLLTAPEDMTGFAQALEPRAFRFPEDHGPHPDFRTEWWYFTGNLTATSGRALGFELTLFRFALQGEPVEHPSAWATRQAYMGHLAVTDVTGEAFFAEERFARGGDLGLAGATRDPVTVWLNDWRIQHEGTDWRLSAATPEFGIDLALQPRKEPVLNSREGLSQKGPEPGNASYYYSITRLSTTGEVRLPAGSFTVTGSAWMDREWSTSALGEDQQGWDWFALQFDNETELMLYQIRGADGEPGPTSAGTFTRADGTTHHLDANDYTIEVHDHWASDAGRRYPSEWTLRVPDLALELEVEPKLADQVLDFAFPYWEGAVRVAGSRADAPIAGQGYVELVGY